MSIKQMIQTYLLSVVEASECLMQRKLYGHYLVIVYSTIDTLGLLDAPPDQIEARKSSFLAWVESYLLPNISIDCNAIDIWAARCAALHTFTTESNLSRTGKARELQYYIASGEAAKEFVSITKEIDGGIHIPIHLHLFGAAFITGMHQFAPTLVANCESNTAYANRLKNVLQVRPMEPPISNPFKTKPLLGSA